MKILLIVTFFSLLKLQAATPDEVYPLRDPTPDEGRPSWWRAMFYGPVIVVRGSLAQTQKDRPDLLIHGTYDAWSRLTAPSLANQPTENNFYLLLTRLKVAEVLYVDPTLRHTSTNIYRLEKQIKDEFDCILPAEIAEIGEPDSLGRTQPDKDGRYSFAYKLSLPGGETVIADKELILIFWYVSLYPIQGLHLVSFTELENLEQVRSISEYRRNSHK